MNKNDDNVNYFYLREWQQKITYKGIPLFKYPADIITYQQIIYDTKPDVIVETGTCRGSSSLFFYDTMLLSGVKNPIVITSDINRRLFQAPQTNNIHCIIGSSLDRNTLNKIRSLINKDKSVMVSLDSDHTRNHVYQEMMAYHEFVTIGNYMVVEDTFLGAYGPFTQKSEERFQENTGKTPKHALEDFLKENNDFIVDKDRNKYFSMNPDGFLKKIK